MTTVQPGSTSPRWDHRNSGFVSPAQLQQWKQAQAERESARASSPAPQSQSPPPTTEQQQLQQPLPPPPPPLAGPPTTGHARLGSFSLFKSFVSQQHSPPAPASSDADSLQPQSPAPHPNRRMSEDLRTSRAAYPSQQTVPANGNGMHARAQSASVAPPPPPQRSATATTVAPPQGLLHPEIKSIVELTAAHAHKIYFSGPLLRRIERQADGQKPTREDGWWDVWAQLGGTTLSVWDMRAVDEASKEGKQAPPTYINITDSFVHVLEAMSFPAIDDQPPKRYTNILTLNTAGSNLLLFSCPSREALISWAAAIRLSAWEKSRLEEIYTAHLTRIILNDGRSAPSPLVNGRMEGWMRIRIAGQTDWKQMWMVVCAGGHSQDGASVSSTDPPPASPSLLRKKRMSSLFARERSPPRPTKPVLQFYASPKPKDRKKPALTMRELTQVFAVYPERPEWISRSTLMKLEGQLGDEDVAAGMKLRESWVLVMPEFEGGDPQASEMLKWLIGMHDAFELYGRPNQYSWNPRDPRSMMFAYPIGPQRDLLFLDRELAETLDARDDNTSSIRSRLQTILFERMRGPVPPPQIPPIGQYNGHRVSSGPPTLPPLRDVEEPEEEPTETAEQHTEQRSGLPSMRLPPLDFETSGDSEPPAVPEKRPLTPIIERSGSRSLSAENTFAQASTVHHSPPAPVRESSKELVSQVLDKPVTNSPTQVTSPLEYEPPTSHSDEASSGPAPARPAGAQRISSFAATPSHQQRPSIGQSSASQRSVVPASPPPEYPSQSPRPTSPRSTTSSPQHITSTRVISPRPSSPATALSSLNSIPSVPTTPTSTSAHTPNKPNLPSVPASPAAPSTPVPPPAPPKPPAKKTSEADDILGEAGALYYMRMQESSQQVPVPAQRRQPPPPAPSSTEEDESEESTESSLEPPPAMLPPRMRATTPPQSTAVRPPASRRTTGASSSPLAADMPSPEPGTAAGRGPSRPGFIRKPSGARALPASKMPPFNSAFAQDASPSEQPEPHNQDSAPHDMTSADISPPSPPPPQELVTRPSFEEDADALAALTFLEQEDRPAAPEKPTSPVPQVVETPSSPVSRHREPAYRSSFMPSKAAAERKAKSQAQQAAHQAAASRPGKANGKAKARTGGWAESSDEEEEEEEEEDDDADSDTAPPPRAMSVSDQQSVGRSTTPSNAGRPVYGQQDGSNSPARSALDVNAAQYPQPTRPPRELPQLPPQRLPGDQEDMYGQRRLTSAQYSEAGRASFMEGPRRMPSPLRPQSEYPHPPPARQTIWSQVLDPNRVPTDAGANNRDTFVQLEDRTQAMTKAFTPHGLLSAGLQDREDRSAKRQEELARESGASLINVPNKPPPPQTGLLGAVTAHERERKREGGIGATLTEREREKRLAEDRQRKLDEFQRQQLDQMQQGGSMYGGMGMPGMGFNPMMNPMMMGMNPMMTGGWFPGMMPGFSPQMLAAQQAAAQAYQQAMMAFTGQGEGGAPQLNPMMTGGSMAMGGMDPRMSMMSMPMMSPGMGMMSPGLGMTPTGMSMNNTGMGMNHPGMGMNPGMPMSPGMGMGGMSPGMGMNGMNPGMGMGMGGMGMGSSGNFDGPGFDPNMRPISSAQNSNSGRQASPALGPRFANNAGGDSPRGPTGGGDHVS